MIRLRDELLLFFAANPEANLTVLETMSRFGQRCMKATSDALRRLVADGLLDRVQDADYDMGKGRFLYLAGPVLRKRMETKQ